MQTGFRLVQLITTWQKAGQIPSNITIGAFRAPRSNFNAAAEQSFLDELAEMMGKDPIDFRLELLKRAKENPVGKNNEYDADRYAGVLKLVKEKSGWNNPENKKYSRGVAAYFCHNSYAAHVVDIVKKDGQPYVERVFSAVDCGVVINPDAAINMVQGAVVDGIGNAFYGGLTHKDGVSEQNNFNRYRMIRHREAPKKIDVILWKMILIQPVWANHLFRQYLEQWPMHYIKTRANDFIISLLQMILRKNLNKSSY